MCAFMRARTRTRTHTHTHTHTHTYLFVCMCICAGLKRCVYGTQLSEHVPYHTNDIPEPSSAAQPWSLTGTALHATDVSAVVLLDRRCALSTVTCLNPIARSPAVHRHRNISDLTCGNVYSAFISSGTLENCK